MNSPKLDLLTLNSSKDFTDSISQFLVASVISVLAWMTICSILWINYQGNWMNYYLATSYMVFFVVMICFSIYVTHFLNMRTTVYLLLGAISILIYLNGVNSRIPVIDMFFELITGIIPVSDEVMSYIDSAQLFIGDSFYQALLTWVIFDVPFQIRENNQNQEWEASVKNVYHTISNQVMFFTLANADFNRISIHSNHLECEKIESFCQKKIKVYSRKMRFHRKKSATYKHLSKVQEQYHHLLLLLQNIRSNPNHLDGHEYLKMLYELEAILKRSRIVRNDE